MARNCMIKELWEKLDSKSPHSNKLDDADVE